MKENWKPVFGYRGYFVSDQGRVMSTKRDEPIILAVMYDKHGYACTFMANPKTHKPDKYQIGRLVLEAFCDYPADPWLCIAHHKDGDRSNCSLENLEWLVCETTDEYDPSKSHRKGVLRPKETKENMTKAKKRQSRETIDRIVVNRQLTMRERYNFKVKIDETKTAKMKFDEIKKKYIYE